MTKSTSLFLDCLRVLAALTVFAHHFSLFVYGNRVPVPGHSAVIVFFVLSGYVISYATLGRGSVSAKQYILARLARLYSVVIPALVLTALAVVAGKALHLSEYDAVVRDYDWLRFAFTSVFLQSVWWRNLCPPGNSPFWSLSYEFWYYAIFGCLVFIRSWRAKLLSVLGCCLVVGSNILLLFPVWLLGAGLYLHGNKIHLSFKSAVTGFTVALAATVIWIGYSPEYPGTLGKAPMFFSAAFLTDWIEAIGVASIIWCFEQAWGTKAVNPLLEKSIRWPAQHSFSLYLFHLPLIIFFQAIGIFNLHLWWSVVLEISVIFGLIAVLSEFTESKRHDLQKFLTWLWNQLEERLKA